MSEYIEKLYTQGKEAYEKLDGMKQEAIDAMLKSAALNVLKHSEELATAISEEVGMGDPATFQMTMKLFPLVYYNYLKGKPAVGVIDDDPDKKIRTYGKPMGVVACLTPSTTNISNGFEISLKAIKSGNAVVLAPHPRAWKASKMLANVMMEGIKAAGGPDNLIQSIEDPSVERSDEIMKICDVVVGTGGADMVKAAYSSGTPAFGVGQGNVPVFISKNYPAEELATKVVPGIVADRCSGNGTPCTCPQHILIPRSRAEEIIGMFEASKAFVVENKEDVDRIRNVIFPNGGTRINREVVGRSGKRIAKMYELEVPEDTRAIMIRVPDGSTADNEVLLREILNPTLRFQFYDDAAEAFEIARKCLFVEGAGHSAQIFSYDEDEIDMAARRLPVVRILVRQHGGGVANLGLQNGLAPATSVGGGTWGGNILSDNISHQTLLNHTMVIYPISEGHIPSFEEAFDIQK